MRFLEKVFGVGDLPSGHLPEQTSSTSRVEQAPPDPMEDMLSTGEVKKTETIQRGHWMQNQVYLLEISSASHTVEAIFKPKYGEAEEPEPDESPGFRRERAAYLIDRILGFHMVPPTVIRLVNGQPGSVQQYISDAVLLTSVIDGFRIRKKEYAPDTAALQRFQRQYDTMRMFDFLVGNTQRHDADCMLDKNGKLWILDNGDAFDRFASQKFHLSVERLSSEVVQRVIALAESEKEKAAVRDVLARTLTKREVGECIDRLEYLGRHFRSVKEGSKK